MKWYEFNRFNKLTIGVVLLFTFLLFLVEFTFTGLVVSLVMYCVTIGFGVSVTFHRNLTHSSFVMNKYLLVLGKFFGSMAGTGSPIMWVQIHRNHHRYSDKDGDPHPPKHILRTLSGTYPDVGKQGLRNFVGDKVSIFIHRHYFKILAVYGLVWSIGGLEMFFYGFLTPIAIAALISNLLNVVAHSKVIGYRNYNTSDNSVNNPLMAFLVFGEGWHNNHHRFPGASNFRQKWWELDLGHCLIQFLIFLKLARIKNNGVQTN